MVFHSCAIRATEGALLLSSVAVTSMLSWSAITCDGSIVVAVNSCM